MVHKNGLFNWSIISFKRKSKVNNDFYRRHYVLLNESDSTSILSKIKFTIDKYIFIYEGCFSSPNIRGKGELDRGRGLGCKRIES